jgi:hypothetical protein
VSMGWRSVVHPLMNPCCSTVGTVAPGTVECVSATRPLQTCRGNLASVVSVSGVGFSLLVLALDHLVSPPFLPHVCLPVDHGPRVTSVVLPVNHVGGFAFVLHIFVHVTYLTSFGPCVLTRLTRFYPVLSCPPHFTTGCPVPLSSGLYFPGHR